VEEKASISLAAAEASYKNATDVKQAMMGPLEVLPMYVQAAEDAKKAAEVAYNIAAQHDDTDAQLEAAEKAKAAWEAAKEHCNNATNLLHNAADLAHKADVNIQAIEAYLDSVETEVDFEQILAKIDQLIEDAGGNDNGIDEWLETIEPSFTKKCSGKSVLTKKNADLNAAGFAH
jgi:multidrug resistance efflux pump